MALRWGLVFGTHRARVRGLRLLSAPKGIHMPALMQSAHALCQPRRAAPVLDLSALRRLAAGQRGQLLLPAPAPVARGGRACRWLCLLGARARHRRRAVIHAATGHATDCDEWGRNRRADLQGLPKGEGTPCFTQPIRNGRARELHGGKVRNVRSGESAISARPFPNAGRAPGALKIPCAPVTYAAGRAEFLRSFRTLAGAGFGTK